MILFTLLDRAWLFFVKAISVRGVILRTKPDSDPGADPTVSSCDGVPDDARDAEPDGSVKLSKNGVIYRRRNAAWTGSSATTVEAETGITASTDDDGAYETVESGTGATSETAATITALSMAAYVRYTDAVASELTSIVADVLLANGALTIAGQPKVPCKLNVRITDANGSISAGTVTIVGVGARGQALSEQVTLTGGTATKVTSAAFATVTSATVAGLAGNAAGDNLSIGQSAALGLPCPATATAVTVFKVIVDGNTDAVGTVDATAGTMIPTTAPNGMRQYSIWFAYTLTPVSPSHSHLGPEHSHIAPAHNHAVTITDPGHVHE